MTEMGFASPEPTCYIAISLSMRDVDQMHIKDLFFLFACLFVVVVV